MSVPSVFQNMISQSVLKRNVIGIKLPPTKEEHGRLDLGDTDSNYINNSAPCIRLPIKDDVHIAPGPSSEWIHGGWYVDAVSVTLDTKPEPLFFNLSGYIATFVTSTPFINLPRSFADRMDNAIGSDGFWGLPCERAQGLPDLTISLSGDNGKVYDFVMHGTDYVPVEARLSWMDPGMCNLFVFHNGPVEPEVPDFISLGSWFFHKFYTIFDADEMTISCAFRYVVHFL